MLKNEAPGLRHDLAIPAWNVALDPIASGESAQVTFTVPVERTAGGVFLPAARHHDARLSERRRRPDNQPRGVLPGVLIT